MSRRKTGRITIRDIAQRTGLSPITVSRALRGDAEVRPDTRARVEGEAERSGYVPNLVALALASNRSRVVGVVIPTLLDSIFASTVEGISRVLRRHNYQFILGSSGYHQADEEQFVRTFLRRRVDGLILPALGHNHITRSLIEKSRLPVVEIGNLPHDPIACVVGFSNERASYAATEHLIASGRRRLAYVGGLGGDNANGRDRLAGFRSCLATYGLPVDERLILVVDYTPHAVIPAIDRLAAALGEFDGLVVGGELWNPIVALEFARRRIAVPEAVAMIGLGDVEHAEFLPTPLTTIIFPRERCGELAAELIIARCEGDTAMQRAWDLGFELRVRASSRVTGAP
jgi:LacI family transcriptional regulator, gluconate utilization system Gnt-I transcriptional repressor